MMKKLWLIIPVTIFAFYACSDNSSTTTSSGDSTSRDSNKMTMMPPPKDSCAPGDSSTIAYWQIDSATAAAMITNNGSSGHPSSIKYDRSHIIKIIKDSFPGAQFQGWKSARYREEDVQRYCSKRCIPDTAARGKVAQYFTKIVVVRRKIPGPAKATEYNYYYFDCATICPPPDPCPSNPNESDQ